MTDLKMRRIPIPYAGQERLQGGMGRAAPDGSTLGGETNSPNPKGVFFEDAEQVMPTVPTVECWLLIRARVFLAPPLSNPF